MDKKNTKTPGPYHGTRPFRGLDMIKDGPFRPGPLIDNPASYNLGDAQPVMTAKMPANRPQPGRFGRIFGRSSYNPSDKGIHELAESMREPNAPGGDNPNVALGFTFLGQFVDHDLTLDASTVFEKTEDPEAVTDFRTPNLDLDNLYGSGPGVDRQMYDVTPPDDKNPVRLLLDDKREFDLPRNSQFTAIIGDLRNDENFLISQLHLAFIKFHNAVVDYQKQEFPNKYKGEHGNMMLFQDASKRVRWHYQWILVHEFLPTILGPKVVRHVLKHGPKLYEWKKLAKYPFMPVEFSTAAYRLGHTMLRQDYVVNNKIKKDLFDLPVFGRDPKTNKPIQSAAEKLDFKKYFDFPGESPAQRSRLFDARVTLPVFNLPFIDPLQDPPVSLAERNMLRARIFGVPSGQEVAQAMIKLGVNVNVYSNADLGIDKIKGLDGQAPLWFYILKESEFPPSNSLHLGPIGGRIVAEFIIALISDINGNYLHNKKSWKPDLPSAEKGNFTMTDLLKFANA